MYLFLLFLKYVAKMSPAEKCNFLPNLSTVLFIFPADLPRDLHRIKLLRQDSESDGVDLCTICHSDYFGFMATRHCHLQILQ